MRISKYNMGGHSIREEENEMSIIGAVSQSINGTSSDSDLKIENKKLKRLISEKDKQIEEQSH
jgi:hypothetical protein